MSLSHPCILQKVNINILFIVKVQCEWLFISEDLINFIREDPLADYTPEEKSAEPADDDAEEQPEEVEDFGDAEDQLFPGGPVGDEDDIMPDEEGTGDGSHDFLVMDGTDVPLEDMEIANIPDDAWADASEQEKMARDYVEERIKRRRVEKVIRGYFREGLNNLTEAIELYDKSGVSNCSSKIKKVEKSKKNWYKLHWGKLNWKWNWLEAKFKRRKVNVFNMDFTKILI